MFRHGSTQARARRHQEEPEPITFRLKKFLPELRVVVNTIRNETGREEYDRKGYIYTEPMVQLAMSNTMELKQGFTLEAKQFLDAFVKTR